MGNKVLVIVGMHRSGTSLLSRWLHDCGLNVGDNLLGEGDGGNPHGHYEDIEFYDFQRKALSSFGLGYQLSKGEEGKIVITENIKEAAQRIIKNKNRLRAEWGWKDPRTCLFIDLWDNLLENPKYLVVYRDCESVVNSLMNREFKIALKNRPQKLSKYKLLHLWRKYTFKKMFFSNKTKVNSYIDTWIVYNNEILRKILRSNKSYYLINHNDFVEKQDKLFFTLTKKWKFSLTKIDFKTLIDDKLIMTRTKLVNKKFFSGKKALEINEINSAYKIHLKVD